MNIHDLIRLKLLNKEKIKENIQVRYRYSTKTQEVTPKNVVSVIGKFMNDALKELGIIVDDSVKYLNQQFNWIVDQAVIRKILRMEIEVEEIELMEALKIFDIDELMKRQAMLVEKFDKKETLRKRSDIRLRIAYITELGELAQELKSEWNYWKNSTKELTK